MAGAIWRPGRRIFSTAAILMLLLAVAHTAGNLAPGPVEPAQEKLFQDMNAVRVPVGMGMNPSVKDLYFTLVWTTAITFAGLGLISLTLAAISETPERVLRRVSWINALWVGGVLIVCWIYRVAPPLISVVIIEVAVIGSLLRPARSS